MKITQAELKRMIKEELEQSLNDNPPQIETLAPDAFREVAKRAYARLEPRVTKIRHSFRAAEAAIGALKYMANRGDPKIDAKALIGNAEFLASTSAWWHHLDSAPTEHHEATKVMHSAGKSEIQNIEKDIKDIVSKTDKEI